MPQTPIPFSALNTRQLIDTHNKIARDVGVAPLTSWKDSRVKLVERVAILNTRRRYSAPSMKMTEERVKPGPKPKPKRETPIRTAILKALSIVSHYEHIETGDFVSKQRAKKYPREQLLSVGLSYSEVQKWLREHAPECTSSDGVLRWTATQVRNGTTGFENCTLPQKRPHGTKRNRA